MPPEQIVYASDYPYGRQPNSMLMALRTARVAGFDEDQIRNLLGRNASRIADGEQPLEPSRPKGGDILTQPTILARIHQYLSMATPLVWTRQADTVGVLGLALNTCNSPANGYQEATEHIRELLTTAHDLWLVALAEDEESEQIPPRALRLAAHPPGRRPLDHVACLTSPSASTAAPTSSTASRSSARSPKSSAKTSD
jgi:hypothetical protein